MCGNTIMIIIILVSITIILVIIIIMIIMRCCPIYQTPGMEATQLTLSTPTLSYVGEVAATIMSMLTDNHDQYDDITSSFADMVSQKPFLQLLHYSNHIIISRSGGWV